MQWRTAVVFTTVSVLAVTLYVLWMARVIVLLVFAGILVGLMLIRACEFLERRLRIQRRVALPVALIAIIGGLALTIWSRGAALAEQLQLLQEKLPQTTASAMAQLKQLEWGRWLFAHGSGVEQLARSVDLIPRLTGILSSTIGIVGGLAIVFFLGIVIAAEPATYRNGFELLFPRSSRDYVNQVVDEVASSLHSWLFARLVSMVAVGGMAWLGLWLLGVPMPGTLGLLAGLLAFIPNIGPILSAIPPVLLALSSSPRLALYVVLLFWGVHAAEGMIITPIAERKAVQLPPALTLSMQLVLALVAGTMGVALAAPITTVLLVLFRTVYQNKVLRE